MENIEINITLTTADLNKDMTADDISLSASDLSHIRSIMEARKILDKVWKKYNEAICTKLNNESTKNVTIVNRSWFIVDEAKVLEEFGEDGLTKVKTKPVEQHYVSKL